MTVVAAGTSPFVMLIKHLEADAELSGLIGVVYPRLDQPAGKQMPEAGKGNGSAPFAIVREGTDLAPPGQNHRVTYQLEFHCQPADGRRKIRKAIQRAEWILDDVNWDAATDDLRVPIASHWQSTQGPYTDPLYSTIKFVGQLVLVAH